MVKSIILCEGETDQALVGCYLEKVAGWTFTRDIKDNPFPKESINWYTDKARHIFGIWQVGGNNFSIALKSLFEREKLEHSIDSVVIITDHDDKGAEQERVTTLQSVIATVLDDQIIEVTVTTNAWSIISFRDAFGATKVQFLYLLVPVEEYGALETFMMNALSEQSEEKEHVIEESKAFVNEFQSDVYLKQRRDRIKAELGVSLSIFSPDRIFTTMKELIDSVHWEKFEESHRQFDELNKWILR